MPTPSTSCSPNRVTGAGLNTRLITLLACLAVFAVNFVAAGIVSASNPKTAQLIKTLKTDSSFKLRANAARLLAKDGSIEALEALLEATFDANAVVRATTCNSLVSYDDRRVLTTLKGLANNDPDAQVKKAAQAALKQAMAARATSTLVGSKPSISFTDIRSKDDEERHQMLRDAMTKFATERSSLGFVVDGKERGYAASGSVTCTQKPGGKPHLACKGNLVLSRMPGKVVLGSIGASGEAAGATQPVIEKAVLNAIAKSLFDDMLDVINQDRLQNGEEELK